MPKIMYATNGQGAGTSWLHLNVEQCGSIAACQGCNRRRVEECGGSGLSGDVTIQTVRFRMTRRRPGSKARKLVSVGLGMRLFPVPKMRC